MDEQQSPARRRKPPLWIPLVLTLVLLPIAVVRIVSASGSDGPSAAGTARPGASVPIPASATATVTSAPTQSAPVGPPPCSVADRPAPHAGYGEWSRTLLDPEYRLPVGYVPPDLEPIEEAGFEGDPLSIRSFVLPDLAALRDAAQDAGHPIGVIASYRSFEMQEDLFERRRETLGPAAAADRTARPGHSEHQLGTTVDLGPSGATDVTQSFGSTPTGRWLTENAYRYGFVQSYPERMSRVTCYGYEPWHFRYLGRARAEAVHASGLTLREYLWREDQPKG